MLRVRVSIIMKSTLFLRDETKERSEINYSFGSSDCTFEWIIISELGLWSHLFTGLRPGWPELVGVYYKTAIDTIVSEEIGVRVVYGPEEIARPSNFVITRVFVVVDKAGNVALVPTRG